MSRVLRCLLTALGALLVFALPVSGASAQHVPAVEPYAYEDQHPSTVRTDPVYAYDAPAYTYDGAPRSVQARAGAVAPASCSGATEAAHETVKTAAGPLSACLARSVAANSGLPTLEINAAKMPNIADDIESAIASGQPAVLTRTTDGAVIASNRAAACQGFCGVGSPDEFPFASTLEGGAGATVRGVPLAEQRIQGGVLSSFYRQFGINDGDQFFATVTRGAS